MVLAVYSHTAVAALMRDLTGLNAYRTLLDCALMNGTKKYPLW